MAAPSHGLNEASIARPHGRCGWAARQAQVRDAADPAVYYLGSRPETPEGLAGTFAASEHRVVFTGHFHRWLAATPDGLLPWDGVRPLVLQQGRRYLIVVAAVCDGWCAVFDTASGELVPHLLPEPASGPGNARPDRIPG
jgi:hypothetical protein